MLPWKQEHLNEPAVMPSSLRINLGEMSSIGLDCRAAGGVFVCVSVYLIGFFFFDDLCR